MAQLLNRKAKENKQEELLVFGYSCKLFRDDNKASSIDNGEHLIPSMADQSLLIDRFDVRGTLYDLQAAESTGDGSELTEAEMKEEEVCNEERYLALYHDIETMVEREEEQKKRLQVELEHGSSSFKQVGFSYNSVTGAQNNAEEVQHHQTESQGYMPMRDEDAFIPPPTLPIPPGVVVPTSIKQHKVIVKTARFIARQGTQMEIVLKTKQSNNILFGFLSFDDVLYQYYRHIVTLIKSGRFHEDVEPKVTEKVPEASFNPPQSAPGSLAQTPTSVKTAPPPDCSYTKLISKIRENQAKSGLLPVQTDSRSQSPVVEMAEPKTPLAAPVKSSTPAASVVKLNKPLVGLVDYPSFNNTNEGYSDATTESEMSEDDSTASKPKMNGNNKANLENYDNVKWPSNRYSQVVMDRIACNVVKYGLKFEQILRTRSDVRFRFVQRSHEMFSYYQLKVKLYRDVFGSAVDKSFMQKSQIEMREIVDRVVMNIKNTIPNNTSKQLQAISFSIKQRKNEPEAKNSLPPTSFPLESSSSEGENEELSLEDREKRRLEREERRKWRKMKREQYEKERARIKEENERMEKKKAEEEEESGSSANEMYDVFKFAQENTNVEEEESKSPYSSNTKTLKRKQAAHAFLSKLTKNDEVPQMIGPQLPPEIASQMMDLEESPPVSPATSLPFSPSSPPPPPPAEDEPNPPPGEEEPSKDGDSASKESNNVMSGFSLPVSLKPPEKLPKSSLLAAAISTVLTNAVDTTVGDSGVEKYRPERARKRKHKSQDRGSLSVSPERRSSVSKKRKRRHSPHHKKHHKTSSRKKSSHKSKKGKKKKSKRYRRSSSRSYSSRSRSRSVSSDSRSNSLSSRDSSPLKFKRSRKAEKVTTKSDSEDEVQVISDTASSRASSIVSVKSRGVSPGNRGLKGETVEGPKGEDIKGIAKLPNSLNSSRGSSVSREVDSSKGVSGSASPLLPSKSLLSKSSQGFDLKSSSAMAKITEGLRAKVHAMMEAKK